MPIFSDLGLYYGGSPPPTLTYITPRYNPFPGPPSSHRLPPHSRISKYLPLLPTISESSPLYRRAIPLSRLSSPRPILSLPPYQPPRPIRINTADIDVSTPRRAHRTPNNGDRPGTIKRDRTVVRLQTKHARDQKKKTPGEKLMEKFLIRDKAKVVDTEYKKKVLEAVKNEGEKKLVESNRTLGRDIPVLSQVEVLDRLLVEEQEKVNEEECAASRRSSDAMLQPISDYKMDLEGESAISIRLQTVKRKKHKKSKSCDLEPTLEIVENKDVPEKNMLQRRNTVKKIRRMSEDILVALDTNNFIPSSKNDIQSMSSVNENIQLSSIKCKPSCKKDTVKTNTTCISLVPVTGETLPAENKNKLKKRVEGVKNKISIQVSIDNNVGVKQFKNKMLPKFIVDDISVEETLISKRKLAQKIHYEVVVEDFIESVDKTEKSKTTNKESNLTVNGPTQLVDKVNKSPYNKVTKITNNGIKNSKTEKYTTAKVLGKEKQNSIFSTKENNFNFFKSEEDIVLAKDKVADDNLTHISIKESQELKRVKSIQEQKLTFENRSERESNVSNKETKSMSSIISSSLKETVIEKDKVILKREIINPNSFNSKTNSSTKENDIIKEDERLLNAHDEHANTQEGPISSAQGTSSSKVSYTHDSGNYRKISDTQLFETPTKSYVETFQIDTSEKDILNKIIQKTGDLHIKRNEKESLGNINKIFIKNDNQNGKSSLSEALCTTATKSFVSKICESKKSTIDITANTDTLPPQQEAPIDFWAVLNTSASGTRLNEAYKSIKIINKRAKIRDRDMDISRTNEGKGGEEIASISTPNEDGENSVSNIQSNIKVENISKLEVGQFKFKAEVERKKYNFEGKEKKTKLDKSLANNFEPKFVVGLNKDQNTKQPKVDTFGKNNFEMKGEKPQQIIKSTMPLNGREKEKLDIKLASKVLETKVEAIHIADKMKQPHMDAVVVNSNIDDNDFLSQVSIETISKPAAMKLQTKEQRFKTTTDLKNKCLGSTNKGILDSKYETQYSADENCYINPINQSLKSLGEPFSEETSIILNVMESNVDSNRLDINDSMKLPIAITNKTIDILKCSSTVKEELSHQNVVNTTASPVQNNLTTNINDDISRLWIGPTEKVDYGDTSSKQSDFIQPGTSELKKSGNIEKVEELKIFSPPNNNNLPEDKNSLHTNILLSKNSVKNKKIDNVLYKINKNIPKDKIIKETEPSPTIKAEISKTKDSMEKKEQFSSVQMFPRQKTIEVGKNNFMDVNIKNVEEVSTSNKISVKLEKQPDTKENPFPSASRSSPKNIEVFEESTQKNLHPDTFPAPRDSLREHTIVGKSPEEGSEQVSVVTPPPPLEDPETSSEEEDTETESDDEDEEDCDVNCHRKCETLMPHLCGVNQKLIVEALSSVKKGNEIRETGTPFLATNPDLRLSCEPRDDPPRGIPGRVTPPATSIPHFRKYNVDDFHFLKLLGKGSFGKVLLAELKNTECYYAIKCLKKDVVLEDDDVECTLIERKVLALGTKHPYLCHLFCTFQTESHLFFVMEYLNGGDLMFHIQQSGKFPEPRACFYGAEIVSGLHFLHKKGIVYRDLKLDNILLDFDGHVRIADFGMCKLQIFLDRTADTFCGTPDYMAPEIIKGLKYNQCVDWWSFGILLYEMLIGQSPFSGCDEDELFWSICNERPHFPLFLSREANSIISSLLQKDSSKRLGTQESGKGEVMDQPFFRKIDWNALERRELIPPFKPRVQHPLDVQYFDKTFTAERAKLTPVEKNILESMDQTQFQGFSYTNPNATD